MIFSFVITLLSCLEFHRPASPSQKNHPCPVLTYFLGNLLHLPKANVFRMYPNKTNITATELLFLLHPNASFGRELVKLSIQELICSGHISVASEVRLIRRKHVGDIERVFVIVSKVKPKGTTGFEQFLLDLIPEEHISLRNYFRAIDKKLYGIEVFKHLVYKDLLHKKLIRHQFSIFGLFRSKYKLSEEGETIKSEYLNLLKKSNTTLPFPYFLISEDTDIRLRELEEIEARIPGTYKHLKQIPADDWESASNLTGLDPRGFLPI